MSKIERIDDELRVPLLRPPRTVLSCPQYSTVTARNMLWRMAVGCVGHWRVA